jgi:integrase
VETRGVGRWLYLRALLPPKAGSSRLRPFQQRIALGMVDIPQNKQRLRAAVKRLEYQLATDTFSWSDWVEQKPEQGSDGDRTLEMLLKSLEAELLATRNLLPTSFERNYREILLRAPLPRDRPPTGEDLRFVLMQHSKQSPTRRLLHFACVALAKHIGLAVDLSDLKGTYSPALVEPIELPSDTEIVAFAETINSKALRYCYGLMATYGLRPHECWYASVDATTLRCEVSKGKTGRRLISPLPRSWSIDFELTQKVLPSWSVSKPRDFTTRFYKELCIRRGMTWRPYAMRHCFARRLFEHGVSASLGAKLMGHSEAVHSNTYQRWIDEQDVLAVFERFTAAPPQRPPDQ